MIHGGSIIIANEVPNYGTLCVKSGGLLLLYSYDVLNLFSFLNLSTAS